MKSLKKIIGVIALTLVLGNVYAPLKALKIGWPIYWTMLGLGGGIGFGGTYYFAMSKNLPWYRRICGSGLCIGCAYFCVVNAEGIANFTTKNKE